MVLYIPMYIFVWNRPTVQCIAMIGPGGDKDTNMPVGRTRWDSWCPGCISQWNKSIERPKKHHLVLNLLSTMKWKTIIIFLSNFSKFCKFSCLSNISDQGSHGKNHYHYIISTDNFPASSLSWKLYLNAIVSTLQISTGYCMFWSLVTWWISDFSCLWPTLKSISSYII